MKTKTSHMLHEVLEELKAAIKAHTDTKASRFTCTIRHGLSISCGNTEADIGRVLRAYEFAAQRGRSPVKTAPKLPTVSASRGYQKVFDQFVADGEIDNALMYARIFARDVYFASCLNPTSKKTEPRVVQKANLLDDPRFVIGQVNGFWSVTHLDSGFSAGPSSSTKKGALSDHAAVKAKDPDRFEQVLANAACDFQATAINHFLQTNDLPKAA